MGIYAKTLLQLVESVCRQLHDYTGGTSTGAGSTTTLVDSLRNESDDFWNEAQAELYISSGTYAGSTRLVSDFVQSTGTLTWTDVLAGSSGSGVTYTLHKDYKRADIVHYINLAIDMVAEEAHVFKLDQTSTTLVAGTFEYNVPSGFMYINRITMANADGDFDEEEIPPNQWIIVPKSTPVIKFLTMPSFAEPSGHYYGTLWRDSDFVADRILRIEGVGSPAILSTDSSTCPISPAYITFQAAALAHMSQIKRSDNDPDEHAVQYKLLQDRADIERKKIVSSRLPANSKRVRE